MKKRIPIIGLIFLLLFLSYLPISIGNNVKVEINTLECSHSIAYAYFFSQGMVKGLMGGTILGPYTGPSFPSGGTWANGNWYIIDHDSAALYIASTEDGSLTLIGGSGTPLNGIAYDITTGIMYGASSYNLYKIDINTGAQTLVGSWGSNHLMIDIGIDNNGVIYGHDIVTDSMYIINKDNGSVTLLGGTGQSCTYAQGMEYDHENNILYAAAYTSSGNLFRVNTTTGFFILEGGLGDEVDALAITYTNIPPDMPTINGPISGDPGISFDFSLKTTDYEQDDVYYWVDWGDNTNSGWFGPYMSGTIVLKNHTYPYSGIFYIKAKAKDNFHESSWSNPHKIEIGNSAPEKPKIFGPTTGKIKTEIEFTFIATDPNEDQLYYMIKWGDGTLEDWFGIYNSGQEVKMSHSWKKEGNWYIQVKAKDTDGLESSWSILVINIPITRNTLSSLFLDLAERFPILEKVFSCLIKR